VESLRIVAHLRNGYAAEDPWSPSIDGIIAYWLLREQLGDEMDLVPRDQMRAVEGLPLGVSRAGALWWYDCSSPIVDEAGRHIRHFHRRFDAALAEPFLAPQKARINVQAGPTKQARLTTQTIICNKITWMAIGDGDEVARLLRRCSHVGRRRAAGNGRVVRWEVTADGDPDAAKIHRPLPVEACDDDTRSVMEWGFRPPAYIRENQTLCRMPA